MRSIFININQFLAVICIALTTSCQQYDVTINDQLVYQPKSLFRDYSIADPALEDCIEQVIIDANITNAADLKQLNCSNAGVTSLEGLATFTGLTGLKLSDNQIRNLVELGNIKKLEDLILANNNIIDPVPLSSLPNLKRLDLSGNSDLQCPHTNRFGHIVDLKLPKACATP
tara:strand:- start:617 stop:1132 length:516 start_codon:yes stop_codon:yes gene_type:complete